jgi:hypothetical protein
VDASDREKRMRDLVARLARAARAAERAREDRDEGAAREAERMMLAIDNEIAEVLRAVVS